MPYLHYFVVYLSRTSLYSNWINLQLQVTSQRFSSPGIFLFVSTGSLTARVDFSTRWELYSTAHRKRLEVRILYMQYNTPKEIQGKSVYRKI